MSEAVRALALNELVAGAITAVRVSDLSLCFYLVDGVPYCTQDLCTHEQCFISDGGFVEGDEVECTCHGARFSIKTGAVTMPPAVDPLPTFAVEVRDGDVYVYMP